MRACCVAAHGAAPRAGGLEFPIAVWWEARATLATRDRTAQWFVERTGSAWAMSLDGLEWEEPEGGGLLGREGRYAAAERRRVGYVAATRARDLLVLPRAGETDPDYVTDALVGDARSAAVRVHEAWTDESRPAWAEGVEPPARPPPAAADRLAAEVDEAWSRAAAEAGRPRWVPRSVTAEARTAAEEADAEAEGEAEGEAGARAKPREGRFGRLFGATAHAAIGLALREPALGAAGAVARAALATGLAEHRAEAAEDVSRALAALEAEVLRRPPGVGLVVCPEAALTVYR